MKGSVMPQARHNHGFLGRKALEDQLRTAQQEADEARQQASGKEQSVNSLEARLKSAEKVSTLAYIHLANFTVQSFTRQTQPSDVDDSLSRRPVLSGMTRGA